MRIVFDDDAWDDYLFWHRSDRRMVQRINRLIEHIRRDPFDGIGKPEQLRHALAGAWSRRIDAEHRLVYRIEPDLLIILQAHYHYEK